MSIPSLRCQTSIDHYRHCFHPTLQRTTGFRDCQPRLHSSQHGSLVYSWVMPLPVFHSLVADLMFEIRLSMSIRWWQYYISIGRQTTLPTPILHIDISNHPSPPTLPHPTIVRRECLRVREYPMFRTPAIARVVLNLLPTSTHWRQCQISTGHRIQRMADQDHRRAIGCHQDLSILPLHKNPAECFADRQRLAFRKR